MSVGDLLRPLGTAALTWDLHVVYFHPQIVSEHDFHVCLLAVNG